MKNLYYFIVFLSMSIVYGQAPTLDWLNVYGETGLSVARKSISTSDGGYMIAGIIGFYPDLWLFKLDASGHLVWQNTYGGSQVDLAYGIVEINGEGFVIAGYTNSNDGDLTVNRGGDDIWVFKIDYSGNILWQKVYGGTLNDRAYKIIPTSDGGFIIVGSSESSDYDFTTNQGSEDICLIKIDSLGNLLWQKTFGGSQDEYLYDIKPTIDGNYIVCGSTTSSDGDVLANHGNNDFWILKIDGYGNLLWNYTYGGSDNDYANGILNAFDGSHLVVGITHSSNGDISNPLGNADVWLIKIDASGNLIWEKTYGGSGIDNGYRVLNASNGGFVLAGITTSSDGDVTVNYGGSDIWIFKTDGLGNLKWQVSYGGSDLDNLMDIIYTDDNNYLFCGNTFSTNGDMYQNEGGLRGYVAKLINNELSVIDNQIDSVKVYPNPIGNYVTISTTNNSIIQSVNVVDINSRIVLIQNKITNNTIDINMSILSPGMYFVNIETDMGIQTVKVIKK